MRNGTSTSRELLRLPETADALGASLSFVKKLVQSGELPTVRIRSAVRVSVADLHAFIAARKVG